MESFPTCEIDWTFWKDCILDMHKNLTIFKALSQEVLSQLTSPDVAAIFIHALQLFALLHLKDTSQCACEVILNISAMAECCVFNKTQDQFPACPA